MRTWRSTSSSIPFAAVAARWRPSALQEQDRRGIRIQQFGHAAEQLTEHLLEREVGEGGVADTLEGVQPLVCGTLVHAHDSCVYLHKAPGKPTPMLGQWAAT